MNSSISSFKAAECKVVLVVALAVIALEMASRLMAPWLDSDRTHIHAFPEIVEEMKRAAPPRVLIYGNSLVRNGVDGDLLAREISTATSKPCRVSKITPVGTAVRDWIYLYDTYFTAERAHPEVAVIGFVAHHLPDGGELKIRRLARHFCSYHNIWPCLRDEAPDFDEKALGALSFVSAIYGDQPELQWGSIHLFVPEYTMGVRKLNHFLDDEAARKARARAAGDPSRKPPPKTYEHLARLLEVFKQQRVRVYLVPMPQPEVWDLDPNLVKAVEAGGATLLDARAVPGITRNDFSDGYHLGESGANKLTRFLAEALADDLAP